jgi:hypothetical protein
MESTIHELSLRVQRLEQSVRRTRKLAVLFVLSLTAVALGGCLGRAPRSQVLRARGLVIEDERGRPRVLLGAPIAKVVGRSRADDVTGVVIVGEDGADRVQVGNVGGPQIGGVVQPRRDAEAAIVINDSKGNERGGFGVFDDGRVVLGLDYPDREAIILAVHPEGIAGAWLNGPAPQGFERAGLVVTKEGQSLLKLADVTGMERVILMVDGNSAAKLLLVNTKDKSMRDALKKIVP